MCYVNLLGVRENGLGVPAATYPFSGSWGLMIVVGLAREFVGGGLPQATWQPGTVPIGHGTENPHRLRRHPHAGPRVRPR